MSQNWKNVSVSLTYTNFFPSFVSTYIVKILTEGYSYVSLIA